MLEGLSSTWEERILSRLMSDLTLLPSRGALLTRRESSGTKKHSPKQFVFLVETEKPGPNVSGKAKAIINAHIAKQTHDKRKAQQELSQEAAAVCALGKILPWLGLPHGFDVYTFRFMRGLLVGRQTYSSLVRIPRTLRYDERVHCSFSIFHHSPWKFGSIYGYTDPRYHGSS